MTMSHPILLAIASKWRHLALLAGVAALLLVVGFSDSFSKANPFAAAPVSQLVFDLDMPSEAAVSPESSPELQLQRIQKLLETAQYADAAKQAEKLAQDFPTFQLGALLYAELLNLSTDAPQSAPLTALESKDKARVLAGLDKELRHRLNALRSPYPVNTIPKGLGFIAASTEYFGVVDTSASRMYVFRNTGSAQQATALTLVKDFYVSVGLKGIYKQEEGDARTPIGVYFTQKSLPAKRLPDLYGVGAITLNYPNLYDLHQGRTGSGIWVHGTPSAQYSRLPEASDGCLVLSNDTMTTLLNLDKTKGIPLFIQEKIEWVPATQAFQLPETLRQVAAQAYPAELSGLKERGVRAEQLSQMGILHLLSWRDQDRTVVLMDIKKSTKGITRTYWEESEGSWKLVAESPV